jgi:hypothetical protein
MGLGSDQGAALRGLFDAAYIEVMDVIARYPS